MLSVTNANTVIKSADNTRITKFKTGRIIKNNRESFVDCVCRNSNVYIKKIRSVSQNEMCSESDHVSVFCVICKVIPYKLVVFSSYKYI